MLWQVYKNNEEREEKGGNYFSFGRFMVQLFPIPSLPLLFWYHSEWSVDKPLVTEPLLYISLYSMVWVHLIIILLI